MTTPARTALPTVLIVDDEPLNRDLLRRVLYREFRILEAGDAEGALRHLEAAAVDVILCDQVMPGRSGTELAREVHRRYPRTVALLLTGYEDAPEVSVACRDGVVFEVVGKPWAAAHLKDAIARAVKLARERPRS
jgi:two-component system, NtrC family, response regulator HupR/HoxA